MKFYPKGLLLFAAFVLILFLAIQYDVGFAGVMAIIVIEVLVFFGASVFHGTARRVESLRGHERHGDE